MGRYSQRNYEQFTDGNWHDVNPADYKTSLQSLRSSLQYWAKKRGGMFFTFALPDGKLSIRYVSQIDNG